MYERTIKYIDYDGNEREEKFLFHLTKAEVLEWLMTNGDYTLDKVLEKLATERNGKKIMKTFKDLIRRSYCEKSLDGRRLIKTDEVKDNFMQTEAYSILFAEIVTDAAKAAEFVNNIIPTELADGVKKLMAENPEGIPAVIKDYVDAANSNVVTIQ